MVKMINKFTKLLVHTMTKHWKQVLTIFIVAILFILVFGFTAFATEQFTIYATLGYVVLLLVSTKIFIKKLYDSEYYDQNFGTDVSIYLLLIFIGFIAGIKLHII